MTRLISYRTHSSLPQLTGKRRPKDASAPAVPKPPSPISPLRQQIVDDMKLRRMGEHEQLDYLRDLYQGRDVRFHETVVAGSKNPVFLLSLRGLNHHRRLITYRSMMDRSRFYDRCREHIAIIDLLLAGRNGAA
jgi:DNA-binding GntR family transcriptional regulator